MDTTKVTQLISDSEYDGDSEFNGDSDSANESDTPLDLTEPKTPAKGTKRKVRSEVIVPNKQKDCNGKSKFSLFISL
jgi:hypothetical protein